jgi:hypothetical protein
MRCATKVPSKAIEMTIAIAQTKWDERAEEVRTQTLKLRKQLSGT